MNHNFQNWGGVLTSQPNRIIKRDWRLQELPNERDQPFLAFGNGRSYGDVCLNNDATILDTSQLNRMIAFDRDNGIIHAEAGVLLGDILELIVPAGWFLPVVPGTRLITIGGAIANDVHGKNHHSMGCFGNHLQALELLTSTSSRLYCSLEENKSLFEATIGGLGLTGLIISAEIKLLPVKSNSIEYEEIPFKSIDEFHHINEESSNWEYTVSWIDCLSSGKALGRGIYTRGRHADMQLRPSRELFSVPFTPPISLINKATLNLFNQLYYQTHSNKTGMQVTHYRSFFFPLDRVKNWNRIYGRKGFYQYQCVIPDVTVLNELLANISSSGEGSFLAVLKEFGDITSPGLLSFPRSGLTLALDFPNKGVSTKSLMEKLDNLVLSCGGAIYPAKDARMSENTFKQSFNQLQIFSNYIDPQFSSSFWRRMQSNAS